MLSLNTTSSLQSSATRWPRVLCQGSGADALQQRLRRTTQVERRGGVQQGEYMEGEMNSVIQSKSAFQTPVVDESQVCQSLNDNVSLSHQIGLNVDFIMRRGHQWPKGLPPLRCIQVGMCVKRNKQILLWLNKCYKTNWKKP